MVRIRITIDEELYQRLMANAPPRAMSALIAQLLRHRPGPDAEELAEAYRQAAKESWRPSLARAWKPTEVEVWPG